MLGDEDVDLYGDVKPEAEKSLHDGEYDSKNDAKGGVDGDGGPDMRNIIILLRQRRPRHLGRRYYPNARKGIQTKIGRCQEMIADFPMGAQKK